MDYICNLNPVFELGMFAKFLYYGGVKFIEHQGNISLVCSKEDLTSEMLPDERVLRSKKFYWNDATESVLS